MPGPYSLYKCWFNWMLIEPRQLLFSKSSPDNSDVQSWEPWFCDQSGKCFRFSKHKWEELFQKYIWSIRALVLLNTGNIPPGLGVSCLLGGYVPCHMCYYCLGICGWSPTAESPTSLWRTVLTAKLCWESWRVHLFPKPLITLLTISSSLLLPQCLNLGCLPWGSIGAHRFLEVFSFAWFKLKLPWDA